MDMSQFSPSTALLTVILLALAPFVAVMVTSFTKIVVVLSLLRNALGVQQIPPNVVLNGMALILTVYVMYPVGTADVRGGGRDREHRREYRAACSRRPTPPRSRSGSSCSSTRASASGSSSSAPSAA